MSRKSVIVTIRHLKEVLKFRLNAFRLILWSFKLIYDMENALPEMALFHIFTYISQKCYRSCLWNSSNIVSSVIMRIHSENSLLRQLHNCALTMGCPKATVINVWFYKCRFEVTVCLYKIQLKKLKWSMLNTMKRVSFVVKLSLVPNFHGYILLKTFR